MTTPPDEMPPDDSRTTPPPPDDAPVVPPDPAVDPWWPVRRNPSTDADRAWHVAAAEVQARAQRRWWRLLIWLRQQGERF